MKHLLSTLAALAAIQSTLLGAGADDPLRTMLLVDQLELRNDDAHTRSWDASFYIGYDLNKLYLYSEGDATSDGLEKSQNDLVYSHAIAPFWDVQAGISYDKNADASRTWGEIAVAGLAPTGSRPGQHCSLTSKAMSDSGLMPSMRYS